MEKDIGSSQTEESTEIANDLSENGNEFRKNSRGPDGILSSRLHKSPNIQTLVKNPTRKYSEGSNFIPKTSINIKKPSFVDSKWTWKNHRGLIFGISPLEKKSSKIALFDMDGTLIENKRGRRVIDWEFFNLFVPQKLRELKEKGFRIVIASNQLGVSLNMVSASDLQKKIEEFISQAGVEASAMLATRKDKMRKPDTGMWMFLLNTLNCNYPIDVNSSFFVGDSAGRIANGTKSKDASSDDILFAKNCGLQFFTPDEFFVESSSFDQGIYEEFKE